MERDDDFNQRTFRIGDLHVEPSRNLISKKDQDYSLEPMIMHVLTLLVENPMQVVARDDFINRIWGVEFGADESLTRAISILRKTFRSAGEPDGYIETIPKRGYRLTQAVTWVEKQTPYKSVTRNITPLSKADAEVARKSLPQSERPPRKKSLFLVLGLMMILGVAAFTVLKSSIAERVAALSPASETRSIAILSFADMSPQQDQEYFSDGLAEEIFTALAQIQDLRLVGRSSSFAFKGQQINMREIGRRLNVSHVIDGSVRMQGQNVRVNAQLFSTTDGLLMWSKSYDGNLGQIFQLQERISQDILLELRLLLSVGVQQVIDLQPSFQIVDSLPGERSETPPARAVPFDIRSNFFMALPSGDDIIDWFAVLEQLDQALTGSPSNADLVARKGQIQTWLGTHALAQETLDRAASMAPLSHLVLTSKAGLQRDQNAMDAAVATARRNARWNPDKASGLIDMASALMAEGDIVAAHSILIDVRERFTSHEGGKQKLAELYMTAGLYDEAVKITGETAVMLYYVRGDHVAAYPHFKTAALQSRLTSRRLSAETVDMAAATAHVFARNNDPDAALFEQKISAYFKGRPNDDSYFWSEIRAALILSRIQNDQERFLVWIERARQSPFLGAALVLDAPLLESSLMPPDIASEFLALRASLQKQLR